MGGFTDAVVSAGKDILENIGKSSTGQSLKKFATNVLGRSWEANKSPEGKMLSDTWMDFEQNKQILKQKYTDLNKNLSSKVPGTQPMSPSKIDVLASNGARKITYGNNDGLGVVLIHQAAKTPGMDQASAFLHAQNLANMTGTILHDYETNPEWRKMTAEELAQQHIENIDRMKNEMPILKGKIKYAGEGAPFSTFKKNVQQSKEFPTAVNLKPSYDPLTYEESMAYKFAQRFVAPFIFMQHIATALNPLLETSPGSLIKTMGAMIKSGDGDTEFAKTQDFATKAGIFGNVHHDLYAANYYGERSIVAKLINDRAGKIFYSATHSPLFNIERKFTLSGWATASYIETQEMAMKYFKDPTYKLAAYQLRKWGMNLDDIVRQKGLLNDEQIKKAMWRHIDSGLFLTNIKNESQLKNQHWTLRMALMYHTYVTRMARLLGENMFYKPLATFQLRPEYFSQMGLNIAVLGAAFPLAGMVTKNLTALGRGDFTDVHPKQDLENLIGEKGPKAALKEMIDDYTYIGAWGILHSYVLGATRNKAANAVLGPLGNLASRGLEDVGNPAYKEYQHLFNDKRELKASDFKQFLRDAVVYNPLDFWNLGKLFNYYALPTKREELNRHPKVQMKFKSDVKVPKFKKFE